MFKAKWAAFGGKDMFIYQGFVFGFLPGIYYLCPLPESSCYAAVVLCTPDSVSDVPVKVNTHFVRTSFYLEHIKLALTVLRHGK